MAKPSIIRGTTVSTSSINGFINRRSTVDQDISLMLNAAALQVDKGNSNWLRDLLSYDLYYKQDGKPTKQCQDIMAYVKRCAPFVAVSAMKQGPSFTIKITLKKNKRNKLWDGTVDENNNDVLVESESQENSFPLTLREFLDARKPSKPDNSKLSAKAYATAVSKKLADLKTNGVNGTLQDIEALKKQLDAMSAELTTHMAKADNSVDSIDTDRAEQLAKLGGKGAKDTKSA